MERKCVSLQNMEGGAIYPIWNYEGPDLKRPVSQISQVLTVFEYCLQWLRTKDMSFSGRITVAVTVSVTRFVFCSFYSDQFRTISHVLSS